MPELTPSNSGWFELFARIADTRGNSESLRVAGIVRIPVVVHTLILLCQVEVPAARRIDALAFHGAQAVVAHLVGGHGHCARIRPINPVAVASMSGVVVNIVADNVHARGLAASYALGSIADFIVPNL